MDIQDNNGNTPLFWAYGLNNSSGVNLLINAGANKNITNKEGLLYNEVDAIRTRGFMDTKGNLIFEEF